LILPAVFLSQACGRMHMATADRGGMPHITPAGRLTLHSKQERAIFEARFCPRAVANLEGNHWMALVIPPPGKDIGYQRIHPSGEKGIGPEGG